MICEEERTPWVMTQEGPLIASDPILLFEKGHPVLLIAHGDWNIRTADIEDRLLVEHSNWFL